ncbi:Conidial yellow pigment biosynthesis polyketide synthase [Cytospora mali]|uniref:Conidial yellow pigment biosynthesis polyketide synthase n=1 Tax=Cytospora mali TaxID=578113 RepID=A0A194V3R0_CYTMA|nr:Conidial yellow pigment biosynthesis polyketide synthase [Valsa mali var. pyri (nom. inval.)]
MADKLAFLLFGDQSSDTHGFLAEFFRQPERGILANAFLEQAGRALRKEIEALSRVERSKLPKFLSLQHLNERYHAQSFKHPGIDGALLCISQLAHYIDHAEKHYEDVVQHEKTFFVGLCSGMFAAAAITSTPTLSTLVPIAVQVVLMAFRTGRHVAAMAERLCPPAEKSESWTYIISSTNADEAQSILEKFNNAHSIPTASQAYISAVSASSVAISGPPMTLEALSESLSFPGKPTTIPVYGPYHAAHLHSSADVAKILRLDDEDVKDALHKTKPRSPIMSCSTGTWITESETSALLQTVVHEILNDTLVFSKVLDGCLESAKKFDSKSILVMPFGPTQNAGTLANLLKSNTSNDVILRTPPQISKESISCSIGNHGSSGKCRLAIVGMAGRFPDAASHEKLWELLERGLDVHRVVPADRFPVATHFDPTGKAINTSHTPYGCWIEKPGHFDPRFFNMSPREAFQTDPMQRMALTTAYEALEMSGYVPNRTPSTRLDRIGTFYGQTSDDWREINAAQEVDTYFITGGVRAFGPGRINYHFGFSGPSLNIDTACSSSAAAMNVACSSLWARDCDTAIVGGLSCMTNSDIFAGLSRGQFLSKKGPCQTFDNDADGYCRGDGCASVVVKRLEDAEADQDRILAVILGTATNHSADAISITHPHGPTQSVLSTAILDEAGVDPLDVDYVEMHGTGTQAGDGTEMVSVTDVFAPANRKRPANRPLFLGSVKANVGHGEAASGVTALVKVLMMLQRNAIPPHVGIKGEINKGFPKDLSERNVNVAFHTTPFKRRDGKPRRVFINNFSAAGGNTGLLLEDAPNVKPAAEDSRSHHVITLTGKSKAAMIRNAERLVCWMQENPDTPLAHVAYTTTARKIQHYWRMNVAVSDLAEAQKAIADRLKENFSPVSPEQPKVAFLFTGQGSHYPGLGKEFYAHYSVFRQSIDEFNQIAQIQGFPSFLPLIDGSEQDMTKLSPLVVQLGLSCFEMALAKLWASWGIMPSVVLGHSLGEYAALNIAGVLSASDTIYLVGSRARLLMEKCTAFTHAMLAVQGAVETIKEALGDKAESITVACINGPRETVLSGQAVQMSEISAQLSAVGFKCTQLKVPFAFHSAQVEPILDDFERLARSVNFQAPSVPIISPLLGKMVESEPINPEYLRTHAREAVDFLAGLVHAQQSGAIDEKTVWLEVGPHPICANMVKAAFGGATIAVPSVRRSETAYKTLSASLCTLHSAGLNFDWNEFHRDFSDSVRILDLPSYSFDEKNYWLQYTGDWSLTKNRGALAAPATIEPAKPKLSTTSVQKVLSEEVKGDIAIVEIESNLSREDLRLAVTGHQVNGAPLCPSSLYGDMAMTVCDYAYKLVRPDTETIGCNVAHMKVPKTLIFDENLEQHILRLKVTANVATGHADLVFTSGDGANKTEHANCKVYYGNTEEWSSEFDRADYLIKGRIEALQAAEKSGKASKIGRGLAYKLFAALVDYDHRYRGMEEVILDSDTCEATAKVHFQTTEKDGSYRFSPFWIDSLCHISGFIINGTDAVDSREQVFISHGWESMRFIETPVASKEYRSYIRMQPLKGTKMMAGDVYVFDGDRLIGITGGICFQAIPRKVLNMMLPPRGAMAAPRAVAARPIPAAKPDRKSAPAKEKRVLTPSNIAHVNRKLISVTSQVMDILAKEVGVSHDELADNIAFADLGVDSLMGLTVSGRIREDLDLNVDSHVFVDHPTIGGFKSYLQQFERPGSSEPPSSGDSADSSSETETPEPMQSDSGVTTPESIDVKSGASVEGGNAGLQAAIRETIASEMCVEVEEIIAAPDLANLGMDSLMSLSILGTLRERTGLNIPADLFVSNPSLKDVERALGIEEAPKKAAAPKPAAAKQVKFGASKPVLSDKPLPPSMVLATIPKPPRPSRIVDDYPNRKASSVLLQGSHRTATKHLFMIPDGSGSATSYTEISEISPNWAVWGLFSPFMKTPEEFHCGVYGMASKFIDEMKRRQPVGPYSLAGWSAGGVISYEIVVQLTQAGERVENLIIIDAPCPVTIEPLPAGLHAWFAGIGLLGDGDEKKIPSWLLPHFAASVTALSNYTAEPIPKDKCPNVMAIWCEDGVCHLPTDPRPDPYPTGHALFLLDNRTDFGPNRWDDYLDINKMKMRHMPGNHFSMMHGDLAKQLGSFMREALL